MHSVLERAFVNLSKQLLISLLIFLGLTFIFIKSYERFLSRKMSSKFKFLKNRNNETCFIIFLTGVLFIIIILLIKTKGYSFPFIWLLGSISFVIGGALGLMPFSFIEKTKINKTKNKTL